jgi:hypothetical protein
MRAQPTREARVRPKAPPDFNDTPAALLPALASLRAAANGVEAMALVENDIPAHMVIPALEVIAGRAHCYRPEVVRAVCQLVGLPPLKSGLGRARALALWERFVAPLDGT